MQLTCKFNKGIIAHMSGSKKPINTLKIFLWYLKFLRERCRDMFFFRYAIKFFVLASCITVAPSCKIHNPDTDAVCNAVETSCTMRVARDSILIYSDKLLEHSLAVLNRGEKVTLIEISDHPFKTEDNEALKIAKIRKQNNVEGFRELRFFAHSCIVIRAQNVPLYYRADTESSFSHALEGSLAIVTDRKGDWLEVDSYRHDGLRLSGRWICSGYSDDETMIDKARAVERIRLLMKDFMQPNQNDFAILESLSGEDSPPGLLARTTLEELRAYNEELNGDIIEEEDTDKDIVENE